jgi:hypothetical protein
MKSHHPAKVSIAVYSAHLYGEALYLKKAFDTIQMINSFGLA